MLAVDGQQRGAAVLHRLHEQRTAHHQGLLIGQQQAFAGARSRQARRQACGADDGAHDGVHLGVRRYRFKSIWRLQHLRFDRLFCFNFSASRRACWALAMTA